MRRFTQMNKFLQELIKIPSISPKDLGCFDLIEDRLQKHNFDCKRIDYSNVENLEMFKCFQIELLKKTEPRQDQNEAISNRP